MSVEVRQIGPGDQHLFARIADEVFDHAVTADTLAGFLVSPDHVLVVAVADGAVVGQVAAVVHRHPDGRPTDLYIDEVAVTPALQRQGIARRMIDHVLEVGRAQGCVEFWVGTEPDNVAARGLYESYGVVAETFVMYARKVP